MKPLRQLYFILNIVAIVALLLNSSCRYITIKRIEKERAQLSASDSIHSKQTNRGVDFTASGDIPEPWTLQMDFDHTINLTTATHGNFLWYPSEIVSVASGEKKNYSSKDNKLLITIDNQACDEEKKDAKLSSVKTTVNCQQISYSGCGLYISNNKLHNKWMLEKIDDEKVNTSSLREVPYIEFDLLKKKASGHDGCNRFFGKLGIEGNRIRFGPLGATKMACEKPAAINLSLLNDQLVDYYFKEAKLILYFINDSKLTFTPAY